MTIEFFEIVPQAGWTVYGGSYDVPKGAYHQDENKVYLQGLLKAPAYATPVGTVIAYIAGGAVPPKKILVSGLSQQAGYTVRLDINDVGEIIYVGGSSLGYISLSGISFSILPAISNLTSEQCRLAVEKMYFMNGGSGIVTTVNSVDPNGIVNIDVTSTLDNTVLTYAVNPVTWEYNTIETEPQSGYVPDVVHVGSVLNVNSTTSKNTYDLAVDQSLDVTIINNNNFNIQLDSVVQKYDAYLDNWEDVTPVNSCIYGYGYTISAIEAVFPPGYPVPPGYGAITSAGTYRVKYNTFGYNGVGLNYIYMGTFVTDSFDVV